MYQLLETVRIENFAPDNLKAHQQRMDHAARQLWQGSAPVLSKFLEYQTLPGPGIFKCSIRYDQNQLEAEFQAYTIRPVNSVKLVQADTLDYSLKYADRGKIDRLFAQRGDADDVLFIKNGLLTDTSYANVALLKDNQWFTPAKPLLNGTMRQLLLDTNVIREMDICLEDLQKFRLMRLINAMMPWGKGPEVECANVQMC